jgi:hypothetical protein
MRKLTDIELLDRLAQTAVDLRASECALLELLAEVEERRLYAPQGYGSMFAFCTGKLAFSEGSACRRLTAARAARKYPTIYAMLRSGSLHVTAVAMLAPHLDDGNHGELLARAQGLGKRELETMLSGFSPRPPQRDVIRPVALRAPKATPEPALKFDAPAEPKTSPRAPTPPAPPSAAATPELVQISFTAKAEFAKKLTRARDLLAHRLPAGRIEEVLDAALEVLLERCDPLLRAKRHAARQEKARKRREAEAEKPIQAQRKAANDKKAQGPIDARKDGALASDSFPRANHLDANLEPTQRQRAIVPTPNATPRRRSFPAAERYAIWERDQRCTFVGPEGNRCNETRFLEIDHVMPYALGGVSDRSNGRLLCRTHNSWRAEVTFGTRRKSV